MLRRIWRLRPFLVAGAAVVVIVRGDVDVPTPDLAGLSASAAASEAPLRASAPPVPGAPTLVTVGPARLLDTAGSGPLGPGAALPVTVLGRLGVPVDHVDGVVLSVTVVGATERTFVSIGPAGGSPAELIEAHTPEPVTAVVTTAIGADGAISVVNDAGEAHVVVDVAAYLLAP